MENFDITGAIISNDNENTLVSGTNSDDSISNHGSNSTIRALGGMDTIKNYGFYSVIYGGADDDTITNTSENSTINGNEGDDSISNNDNTEAVIYAGAGDDYIFNSHAYYPTLDGGKGNDKIVVVRGHYIYINGGKGNDTILGEDDGDWSMGGYSVIQGGAGNDYIDPVYSDSSSIQGGEGKDTIISEGYNAILNGGKGDDVISLHGASIEGSIIQYDVGDGNDIICGLSETSSIRITSGEEYSLEDSGDDVILKVGENELTIVGGKNLSEINVGNYEITPLDISNDENDTLIAGTELADTIENSGSNVTVNSAQGDDNLINSGEYGSINGSAGNDTITNSGENSKLIGDVGDDDIYNTGANVSINGGYGNDWIESSGENSTITPGAGYDSISIGGKNIVVNYVGGGDTIKGVNETTMLNIEGDFSKSDITEDSNNVYIAHDNYTLLLEGAKLTTTKLNINGNTYSIGSKKTIKLQNSGEEVSVGLNNVSILGGTGNDTIGMTGSNSTLDGGGGEDIINLSSSAKNNLIYFNGDVTVDGFKTGFGAGSDTIYIEGDAPSVDFKTGGLTFYNSENSLTLKNINSTAQVILAYANGDVNPTAFIADDETYNVTDGAAKYYVGATANMNHGISFAGVGKALDVTLNTDYEIDTGFWINNVHSITGGDNETKITGSDKSDTITAGTYKNTLIGGESGDVLIGSSGTSNYFVTAESGRDTIQSFNSGYDEIFVDDSIESVTMSDGNIIVNMTDANYSFLLQDMNDKIFDVNVAGTEYTARVANKKLTFDGETNYYNATGSSATIKSASDFKNMNVWLNQEVGKNFGNTTEFIGDIKYIDGSNATGNSTLAGSSEIENIITAGKGKTSLWGGGISNDTLVAGKNVDTFFYVRGDGNDTIKGAAEDDIVDLGNITLADIRSIEVENNSVVLNFTDDGSLSLNTNSGTNFKLGGQTYYYDKSEGNWQTK